MGNARDIRAAVAGELSRDPPGHAVMAVVDQIEITG